MMPEKNSNDQWPMKNIEMPEDTDVPLGRGGYINHHPGKSVDIRKSSINLQCDHHLSYHTCYFLFSQ